MMTACRYGCVLVRLSYLPHPSTLPFTQQNNERRLPGRLVNPLFPMTFQCELSVCWRTAEDQLRLVDYVSVRLTAATSSCLPSGKKHEYLPWNRASWAGIEHNACHSENHQTPHPAHQLCCCSLNAARSSALRVATTAGLPSASFAFSNISKSYGYTSPA